MAIMEGNLPDGSAGAGGTFNDVPLWISYQKFLSDQPYGRQPIICNGAHWVGQLRYAICGILLRSGRIRPALRDAADAINRYWIAPEAIACAKQSAAELGLTRLHFRALDSRNSRHRAQGETPDFGIGESSPRRGISEAVVRLPCTNGAAFYHLFKRCNTRERWRDIRHLPNCHIQRVAFDMFRIPRMRF